ncbi:MAG: VanZ family protein [Paludibacteraceae bacterium]|nr:VanZ family protein [Paludibacteraceae bacterium]
MRFNGIKLKRYAKTITFSLFVLVLSLVKIPSPDDILNRIWVDVVPIHPRIENSIVTISSTPNADKYEHAIFYAMLVLIFFIELPKKVGYYRYLIVFLYTFLWGCCIELIQELTPHRTANIMDCLANGSGIIVSLFIIFILSYFYERKTVSNCLNVIKRRKRFKRKKTT